MLNDQDEFAGTRRSSMTGPQFGLTLVLNVEQSDYMTGGQTKTVSEWYLQKLENKFLKSDEPCV